MLPSGAWPPNPLQTGAGALSGFASESPRGRNCTCVDPLRRRRPELLGHAEKVDLAAGLPPTTRRSKRRMIVISPREEKWSLHEDLHLDLELRGLASCLLDDEGKNGVPQARDSGR